MWLLLWHAVALPVAAEGTISSWPTAVNVTPRSNSACVWEAEAAQRSLPAAARHQYMLVPGIRLQVYRELKPV